MIKLLLLFLEFLKIGLFTIGGGYAMIPLVNEVVDYGWISQDQFNNMIGLSEVTPGPIALNMATFVGSTQAGFLGGIFATLGVVTPSFVIVCIVAAILSHFSENKYVKATLKGTMFASIGLILSIAITMSLETLTTFGKESNLHLNLDAIKTLICVLIGYTTTWIINKKRPGPIYTIFMSLIIGLGLYFGINSVLAILLIFVLIRLLPKLKD